MVLVELLISCKKIESVHFLHNNHRLRSLLFLLFLIPDMPKDVITSLARLTSLPLRSWAFIYFVGRFPAVLLTALGGGALGNAKYGVVATIMIVFTLYCLTGLRVYQRWNRKPRKTREAQQV